MKEQYKYRRIGNVTDKLFDMGIVKDEYLRDTIFNMTEASYNVLTRSRDKNRDVFAAWDNQVKDFHYEPTLFEMMKDCIQYRDRMNLTVWHKYYRLFLESGDPLTNVTWDRINDDKEKGNHNYTLDNMQPLPLVENIIKANSKPNVFCLYERKGLREVIKGSFETISDIKLHLANRNIMNDVNVDKLIDKAIKEAIDRQWENVEFTYNKKEYLVQFFFIDKLARYYLN